MAGLQVMKAPATAAKQVSALTLAETERIPAVHELIRSLADDGLDLESDLAAALVPRPDVVAFVQAAGPELEGGGITDDAGYEQAVRKGLLSRILEFLEELVPTADTEIQRAEPIPIAELHCPWTPRARTEYRRTSERAAEAAFTIKLRGNGGGGGMGATVKLTSHIGIEEHCCVILARADILRREWSHPLLDASLEFISVDRIDDSFSTARFPEDHLHPCGPRFGEVWPALYGAIRAGTLDRSIARDHCLSMPKQDVGKAVTVSRSRKFVFSAAGVSVETRLTEGVEIGYHLHGPGSFVRYFSSGDSAALYWAWDERLTDCR